MAQQEELYRLQQTGAEVQRILNGLNEAKRAATNAEASAGAAAHDAALAQASALAAAGKLTELETFLNSLDPESASAVAAALGIFEQEVREGYAKKTGYYQGMAVGLADNIRGDVTSTEQFRVRPTGGAGNEVGQIGVLKAVQGAGFSSVQYYPEGSDHTFSADADITDAPMRYKNYSGTVEMGYLMCMECFINKVFDQAALDAIAAKDAGKAAGDKCVWLTPAGGVTSAPTIADGEESVTFSGWRIAMRVKASEVRDHTAAAYWFTDGSVGRQCKDVAIAVGTDEYPRWNYTYILTGGWDTKSAMEWLLLEAQNGVPTVQRKAEQKLLGVTKFGFKTVKSRNLLNPATGKAFVTAYTNDEEGFEDNQCTVIGGLPSGTTLSFQSLLTGETETITVDSNNRFTVPCSGWIIVSGTLPSAIILTWNGKYDSEPADTYETESHSWVVSGLKGKLNGEGEMVQCESGGTMWGSGNAHSILDLTNGQYVRKAIEVTYNGTEDWARAADGKHYLNTAGTDNQVLSNTKIIANLIPSFNTWEKDKGIFINDDTLVCLENEDTPQADQLKAWLADLNAAGTPMKVVYGIAPSVWKTYRNLTYTDPVTGVETALSELQFADNNWSIEETIYDEPTTDANEVQTPVAVTPVLTSEYSMDAAELLDTLSVEYAALEARVAALEAIINA